MLKPKGASLKWIIPSMILLPLFGYLAISLASHGDWMGASLVAGMWVFFTLLATSHLFQALTVFTFSVLAFSQHKFAIGIVGTGLMACLLFLQRIHPGRESELGANHETEQLPTGFLETIGSPGFALWLMVMLALFGIAIGLLVLIER
jgi:hypothetical protein